MHSACVPLRTCPRALSCLGESACPWRVIPGDGFAMQDSKQAKYRYSPGWVLRTSHVKNLRLDADRSTYVMNSN